MLFIGNGVALDDLGGYVEDQWSDLPAAAASATSDLRSLCGNRARHLRADITPAHTRRSRSSRSSSCHRSCGITLVESVEGDTGRYGLLISPFHVAEGLTFWFFGATPEPEEPMAMADLWGGLYAITALAGSSVCLAIILRRYRSIQA